MVVFGEIVARITWAADDPYLRFVGAMSAVALTIVGMVQIIEWMVGAIGGRHERRRDHKT
jgi:hypothetical protein